MYKVEMNYDKAKSHKEFEDYSTKTASNMYLRVKTEKRIRRKMLVPAPAAAPCSGARGHLEAATTHHFSGAARACGSSPLLATATSI